MSWDDTEIKGIWTNYSMCNYYSEFECIDQIIAMIAYANLPSRANIILHNV